MLSTFICVPRCVLWSVGARFLSLYPYVGIPTPIQQSKFTHLVIVKNQILLVVCALAFIYVHQHHTYIHIMHKHCLNWSDHDLWVLDRRILHVDVKFIIHHHVENIRNTSQCILTHTYIWSMISPRLHLTMHMYIQHVVFARANMHTRSTVL